VSLEGGTGRRRDESNFRVERSRLQSKNIIREMVLSLLEQERAKKKEKEID